MCTLISLFNDKIQKAPQSKPEIHLNELEDAIFKLDKSTLIQFDKIFTILLPPLEAIKKLKPFRQKDLKNLPSIRPKYPQLSGSCLVKNFNSLLSMSFDAPSIIVQGGFPSHRVYAEVFRGEDDKYFALVHNLGRASELHPFSEKGKIFPLALYFPTKTALNNFIVSFNANSETDYTENLLKQVNLANFDESTLDSAIDKGIASSLKNHPKIPRENPVYKNFRGLQKRNLRLLIDASGAPDPKKEIATKSRKEEKKSVLDNFVKNYAAILENDP